MAWGDDRRSTAPLEEGILESITGESERVGWAVTSTDGLTRVDGADERHVDIPVVIVVTDHRISFLSAAEATAADPSDAGSLSYDEIAAATVADAVVELSTTCGTTWRFPLRDLDGDVANALAGHLTWIGDVRSDVLARRNDVQLAVGEIREAAASMDWETGVETYERTRAVVDEAIDTVHRTEPVADDVLAPELTPMERDLERAYADLLIEQADSRLSLGQQLVHNDDHEQARDVLQSAQADYVAARDHAEAVHRGDAFLFGEQRDLRDRLERLEWEIDAVAAEPLRQAHESRILARSTTDPDETVDHWEAAFRRYGHVLALGEGDGERLFAGDVAEVREELTNAAGQLIAIHQTLARTEWDEGVQSHREGDQIDAILRLDAAVDHLERAHEVTAEFRPGAADEMAARLETMREGLQRVREADPGDPARQATDTPAPKRMGSARDEDEIAADEPARETESTGITASELADLDTHHEITFADDEMAEERSNGPAEEQNQAPAAERGEDWELVLHRDGENAD